MSIFADEPRPKPPAHEIGGDISLLSVEELKKRVELLQSEIERLREEITAKQSSKNAAESLFR